jgi:S-adenosyl methyltransferase
VLAAVLHFLPDERQPAAAVATLVDALPPGSYLVASHATGEHIAESTSTGATRAYRSSGVPFQPRDSDVFAKLAFGGLDLVPPGVVLVSEWRPETDRPRPAPDEVNCYGGVARKP